MVLKLTYYAASQVKKELSGVGSVGACCPVNAQAKQPYGTVVGPRFGQECNACLENDFFGQLVRQTACCACDSFEIGKLYFEG